MNFCQFFQEWDDCIKDWYNESNPNAGNFCLSGRLSMFASLPFAKEYIPEPYFGNPEKCSAVVININPGKGSPIEDVKNLNYKNNKNYQLIYDFKSKFGCSYSQYINYYSPYSAPNWVPGVNWWQQYRKNYIEKMVKLYFNCKYKPQPCEKSPFALELSPLHSSTIAKINFRQNALYDTYLNNVFIPALSALQFSDIPFGLCFASLINDVMIKSGLFVVDRTWKDGIDCSYHKPIGDWPTKNGKPVPRTYTLLKLKNNTISLDDAEYCFERNYFLNTWDRSGGIIKLTDIRMNLFDKVDMYIMSEISKII